MSCTCNERIHELELKVDALLGIVEPMLDDGK